MQAIVPGFTISKTVVTECNRGGYFKLQPSWVCDTPMIPPPFGRHWNEIIIDTPRKARPQQIQNMHRKKHGGILIFKDHVIEEARKCQPPIFN